jgi:hypothetical protein
MWSIVPEFWWQIFGVFLVISVAVGIAAGLVSLFTYREKRDGKR